MFSGIPQKNRQAAETYFDEHLSHNDYYSQGQKECGHWIGMGAEKLGLKPGEVVTRETFLKLCDNRNPETNEQLTPQNFKGRRIFFDFTCSPPKSVSILAVTMDDQRIVEAHKEASTIAIQELEQFSAARIRKDGIEDRDRTTSNVVGAAFVHTTSRALDPQLHTHFVLFNCTWDAREGRWKAMQTGDMFGAVNYATEVYRNELVKRLHDIGYQTRKAVNGFEIEGVNPKLIGRFSKRSQQRDLAVKRQEERLGRKLTKQEVAHVVHQSRPKKLKGASDDQVREQQLGEIGFFEKRALRRVVADADGKPKFYWERVRTDAAVDHGIAHVFERNSVAPQHRILEAALAKGYGQLDLADLKRELAERSNLVRVGSEFSTREILEKELYLIRTLNAGIEAVDPVANHYEASEHLGTDQRKALAHVITSPDVFTGFRGLAGSGKSATLVELSRALQDAGFIPVFCAPTASAANTLRKELVTVRKDLEAVTLAKLLSDPITQRQLSRHSVIVLDEAGAVGLDDMAKLFDLVQLNRCRVVFSGDTGQHASVARGDALRILEQYSSYRFSELTTIRRQKPQAFRQIVELAAAKQTDKAFAKLLDLGAVTEALADGPQATLYDKAAQTYLSAVHQGKTALLVSPTWSEIEAVTEKVRQTLKADGIISQQEEPVAVFDSLSWTEAQRRNVSQYEPGQRLRFFRKTKHFDRGEMVEVMATVENGLRVRRPDGTEVNFIPASTASSFDVGEARELRVAAGDWLLLQANHGKEFVNGERVQVRDIQIGRIALTDGRVLPGEFNAFTHGYAVTSHSSQSKTVDEVLLVASSKSFAAVNREQFYVSISRGRERVHVFTDDAELLARRVTDSHERKAAVELQALRDDLAKLGFVRREGPGGELASATVHQDLRTIRTMRETGRAARPTRITPTQRLAQIVADTRPWINERLGIEQKESVIEKIEQAEKISPHVKETPEQKPRRSFREQARQNIERHRKQQQQQRRSGGIHI
ncbi:MAG TPA: MobF family relaxase [Verrucomicrobiae bacterium]|jgi:conjugative relaxase-like TrwC/TraI family protein|nr:MobF family relaxase [Verrucomicrobiae bacterium]